LYFPRGGRKNRDDTTAPRPAPKGGEPRKGSSGGLSKGGDSTLGRKNRYLLLGLGGEKRILSHNPGNSGKIKMTPGRRWQKFGPDCPKKGIQSMPPHPKPSVQPRQGKGLVLQAEVTIGRKADKTPTTRDSQNKGEADNLTTKKGLDFPVSGKGERESRVWSPHGDGERNEKKTLSRKKTCHEGGEKKRSNWEVVEKKREEGK